MLHITVREVLHLEQSNLDLNLKHDALEPQRVKPEAYTSFQCMAVAYLAYLVIVVYQQKGCDAA